VLYAEDDNVLAKSMQLRVFKHFPHHQVTFVQDGRKVVELCRAGSVFNVILVDNQMPVQNGADAVREIRAMGYTGVVIGLTGDPAGSEDRNRFEASGLDSCWGKDKSAAERLRTLLRTGLLDDGRSIRPAPSSHIR